MCGNEGDLKYKYCNTLVGLYHPVFSGFADKPFGSEMCYGRGVCDTDPIPIRKMMQPCRIEDNESVTTATISIDDVVSNKYSIDEQEHSILEHEFVKQFLNDLTACIINFERRTLITCLTEDCKKNHTDPCSNENEQKPERKLVVPGDKSSSEEMLRPNSTNASIISIHSPMVQKYLFDDSKGQYRLHDPKPAGPFTEPPNPGKQMKLGVPYDIRSRVKQDFYKHF